MTDETRGFDVVLVEDTKADYDTAVRMLSKLYPGAALEWFETAEDLLAELEQRSPQTWWPRLLVVDVNLSGKTGLEVLRAWKESPWFGVPVIVLSGSAHESELALSYRLGAAGFLRKPTGLDEIRSTWETIGRYWFEAVQPPPPPGEVHPGSPA